MTTSLPSLNLCLIAGCITMLTLTGLTADPARAGTVTAATRFDTTSRTYISRSVSGPSREHILGWAGDWYVDRFDDFGGTRALTDVQIHYERRLASTLWAQDNVYGLVWVVGEYNREANDTLKLGLLTDILGGNRHALSWQRQGFSTMSVQTEVITSRVITADNAFAFPAFEGDGELAIFSAGYEVNSPYSYLAIPDADTQTVRVLDGFPNWFGRIELQLHVQYVFDELLGYGDTDGDDDADFDDFQTLADAFGTAVSGGAADGDFNGDGVVDLTDYEAFGANNAFLTSLTAAERDMFDTFSATLAPRTAAFYATDAGVVPEPASVAIVLAVGGMIAGRRRRAPA